MKNYLLFVMLFIFSGTAIYAQETQRKAYFNLSLEMSSPSSKKYFFNTNQYEINNIDLMDSETGFNLTYGLAFSYNYMLFKRMSVGVLTGFANDNKQYFSHLRLGGNLKYYYVPDKLYNFHFQLAENFPLNTNKFKSGVNVRLGLEFPVLELKNKQLTTSLFWEQNYYKLDNCEKLLNLNDEIPRSLTNHLIGISIGLKL